jgi:hypothetical protein
MNDGIPDSDLSGDALTPEEQAAFEEMKGGDAPEKPVAEPPAEKPVAEEKAEPAKPEDKEPEVQKLVPHGAFEEERQRRKEAQRLLDAERQERARLQGQLEAVQRGQKPPEMTPEEKADWDKDPVAAGKALQAKLDQQAEQARQAEEARAEHERIAGIGQRHAERFAKTQPHFFDSKNDKGETVTGAYAFMRQKAAEKVQARFPSATPQQVIEAVNAVERQHIQDCLLAGENAAEKLWEMALEAGFKPPEPAKAEPPRAPNGQFQKSEAERIADLEQAQRGARSLSSAPAGGGEPEIGMEALANMDDAEFAKVTAGDNWEKLHRRGVI